MPSSWRASGLSRDTFERAILLPSPIIFSRLFLMSFSCCDVLLFLGIYHSLTSSFIFLELQTEDPHHNPWEAESQPWPSSTTSVFPPPPPPTRIELPPRPQSPEISLGTAVTKAILVSSKPSSPGASSPTSHSRTVSFSLPPTSPQRQSRTLSAPTRRPPSGDVIELRPIGGYGSTSIEGRSQIVFPGAYSRSSSAPASPSFFRDGCPRPSTAPAALPSLRDVLLLPITLPLSVPRAVVSLGFQAFVFSLVCGVTVIRIGAAAVEAVVFGRDSGRPRR